MTRINSHSDDFRVEKVLPIARIENNKNNVKYQGSNKHDLKHNNSSGHSFKEELAAATKRLDDKEASKSQSVKTTNEGFER